MKPAQYVLAIETDPLMPGRELVAIYRQDEKNKRSLVGIPLRGVYSEEAQRAIRGLRYAFQYGLGAAREDVIFALHSLPCEAMEAP